MLGQLGAHGRDLLQDDGVLEVQVWEGIQHGMSPCLESCATPGPVTPTPRCGSRISTPRVIAPTLGDR
jgi:hypothetical protein